MTRAVLALLGVSFLWFMVLSLRTGIHPLAFLHTFPYTTPQEGRFKNILQWFSKWLCCLRLLDNLSFTGLENLQVNVVQ
jgi:hypothetical protein